MAINGKPPTLEWTWQLTNRDCGYYGVVLETAGNCTHPKLMFTKTSSLKLGHCTQVSTYYIHLSELPNNAVPGSLIIFLDIL